MIRVKIMTRFLILNMLAGCAILAAATAPPPTGPVHRSRRVHHAHWPVTAHRSVAAPHSVAAQRPVTIRRTWKSGPASTPPETEAIRARPSAPPPRIAASFESHPKGKVSAVASRRGASDARSTHATLTVTAAKEQPPKTAPDAAEPAHTPDPEAQRVQDEFTRLRQDAAARQTFYDDLLGTVQRVRAGMGDENSSEVKPVSLQPTAHPAESVYPASVEHYPGPANPTPTPQTSPPEQPPAPKPIAPQSSLGPYGSSIDPVAYQRVVRWAKANDVPISLALGVAWMESRLNAHAPRGAAGEVGMFQIMPERCRLEGWPPERLVEPEFNAWLGTLLLARYYREEGSVSRAAAKYVAGPGVFNKQYSPDMWAYINWYATTVDSYASYFSRVQS